MKSQKYTSCWIKRGYESLIPVWSGILAFWGSVLQYFGYRESEGAGSCCSWVRKVLKHKNPKADGGVAWSWNRVTYFNISGFNILTISRTRGRGALCWKSLKSRNATYLWSGAAVTRLGSSRFDISEILGTRS
jgi:hypothetical protein